MSFDIFIFSSNKFGYKVVAIIVLIIRIIRPIQARLVDKSALIYDISG